MMMCGDGMSFSDEASDDYLETKPVVEARYQPPEWCRVCWVQVPANGARHRVQVAFRRLDVPVHATWCVVCEVQGELEDVRGGAEAQAAGGGGEAHEATAPLSSALLVRGLAGLAGCSPPAPPPCSPPAPPCSPPAP